MPAPWNSFSARLGSRNGRISVKSFLFLSRSMLHAPCAMLVTPPGVRSFFKQVSHKAPPTHNEGGAFLFCPVGSSYSTGAKHISLWEGTARSCSSK